MHGFEGEVGVVTPQSTLTDLLNGEWGMGNGEWGMGNGDK